MHKDVLLRGCTRPPMILGVPYIPFMVGAGVPLLLAMYLSLYILLLIPFIIFCMRIIAKKDEMIFRLIGLHLVFRFLPKNKEDYGGVWVFGVSRYTLKITKLIGYEN
jgi:type IV secretion system protein VirB3